MSEQITDERLAELIEAAKLWPVQPLRMRVSDCADLASALAELQTARERIRYVERLPVPIGYVLVKEGDAIPPTDYRKTIEDIARAERETNDARRRHLEFKP
jgi:hypothetical protein